VLLMRFSYRMVPEVYQLFWAAMARGEFITDAAVEAGTYRSRAPGVGRGGWVRPRRGRGLKGRCLRLAQREEIARGRARGQSVRSIAAAIRRSPSTVSRELRRNAYRLGGYRATTAHALASARASRPKTAKLETPAAGSVLTQSGAPGIGCQPGLRHSRTRDTEAIHHHYDVSNTFHEWVLGPSMTYSCSCYPHADATLEEAQADKYRLVFDKLRLKAGDRLLDVGCGWGSMVGYAARRGVRTTGITLSAEQAAWAQKAIAEEGLTELAEVRHGDYREIRGRCDPSGGRRRGGPRVSVRGRGRSRSTSLCSVAISRRLSRRFPINEVHQTRDGSSHSSSAAQARPSTASCSLTARSAAAPTLRSWIGKRAGLRRRAARQARAGATPVKPGG
jgi:hypothetical protein